MESWEIHYLVTQKGYSPIEASDIIYFSANSGIYGSIMSEFISDKLFKDSHNLPVFIALFLNVTAISLFLVYPNGHA